MNLLTQPNKPSFSHTSKEVKWVERDMEGKILKIHNNDPQIGFTLFLNPYNPDLTFFTNPIIEIIESSPTSIHFLTEDGEYKLFLDAHFTKLLEL